MHDMLIDDCFFTAITAICYLIIISKYLNECSRCLQNVIVFKRVHSVRWGEGVNGRCTLLRPPAGRQYGMSISQQPLNRSLPNFQQLLLMSIANEGKVESFSSFAYG